MKVREVINRIPNEPILLLQLCKNRQASAMAEDAVRCVDNQIRILQNLKTFANDMAYLCVHALEPKVFQEKLGISLVMWLMFSKYPLMVKDAWDVDLTLKEIPVKEDSDWLRHGGERPKLSTRMYTEVAHISNGICDRIIMYIVESNIGVVNLLNSRVESQSRKIDKLNKKLEEWPTKYSLLEIENAQLRRDNQELSEYVAALQTAPEPEIVSSEVVELRDLSGYKIKVCTTRDSMKLFEWECFDVDAYPTAVENCLKCDLVIIDTGHISHHTFWTVRDYCKNRGLKCVYTSFHNKERLRALAWEALHK